MAASTIAASDAEVRSPPRGLTRPAVVAAVGAVGAAVGLTLAVATGNRGPLGPLTAQFDIGLVVCFVVVGYLTHLGPSRAVWVGEPVSPLAGRLRRWVLGIIPLAWAVSVVAWLFPPATSDVIPTVGFSPAAVGTTDVPLAPVLRSLTFVSPYVSGATARVDAWLWPVAAVVAFVALVPASWALLAGRGATNATAERERGFLVVLGAIAVLAPLVLLATGHLGGGAARWLPAQMGGFVVGMAAARGRARREAGIGAGPTLAQWTTRPALGAVGAGLVVLALGYGLDLPRQSTLVGGGAGVARLFGHVVAAALVTVPLLLRDERRPQPEGTGVRLSIAAVGVGTYLWVGPMLARWVSGTPSFDAGSAARHPEAATRLAVLPSVLWVLGGAALAATATWLVLTRPLLRRAGPRVSRFGTGLAVVCGASFVARLWAVGTVTSRNPGNGDPFFYHAQANMLADGVGFGEPFQWLTEGRFVPSAIHPPLFSLWLTLSSLIGARSFLSHKVMAIFAGLAVVVVAALLARRLTGSTRAGLVAAALVAVYPDLWLIDGTLWPEGMYTAAVGATLLAAYHWRDRPTTGRAALIGLGVGAAVLTRGEALLLLPLLCLPLAWSRRRDLAESGATRWLVHAAIMGTVAVAMVAPWTIRNLVSFDRPVPVSTNSEEVLYYANCPDTYAGPFIGYWSFNCQERARQERVARGLPADPPGDEAQRAAAWGELGREYANAHRDRWPAVVLARVNRVWDLRHGENSARAVALEGRPLEWSRAGLWIYRLVLLPGLVGFWVLRRRRVAVWPLVAMLAMITATAVYAYGHIRFRTVGDLVLLVGAAVAIDAGISRLTGATNRADPAPPVPSTRSAPTTTPGAP